MKLDCGKIVGKVFTSPLTGRSYGVIRELQGEAPADFPAFAGWIPAAEDCCGNCFAVSPTGSVGFWDHETGEVTTIADSLQCFYENCTVPSEVELKPGQIISAWIDPEFARQLGLKNVPKDGRIREAARPMVNRPDIPDSPIGSLRYHAQAGMYEGHTTVAGSPIKLLLDLGEHGDIATSLARARRVLSDIKRFGENAKNYAAKRLLKLKNDSWLDEGERPVSAEQFMARMALEEISFSSDGHVTFYHSDGELFWGHSIQVDMDNKDQFVDADIPG